MAYMQQQYASTLLQPSGGGGGGPGPGADGAHVDPFSDPAYHPPSPQRPPATLEQAPPSPDASNPWAD